jgi:hypothetical protein
MSLSDLLVQTSDGDAAGDDKNIIGEMSDYIEMKFALLTVGNLEQFS